MGIGIHPETLAPARLVESTILIGGRPYSNAELPARAWTRPAASGRFFAGNACTRMRIVPMLTAPAQSAPNPLHGGPDVRVLIGDARGSRLLDPPVTTVEEHSCMPSPACDAAAFPYGLRPRGVRPCLGQVMPTRGGKS